MKADLFDPLRGVLFHLRARVISFLTSLFPHPGPPPERPSLRWSKCSHDKLRFVWRIFAGRHKTKRYGFQCLDCGESGWKNRDGGMGSLWVADRNCRAYFDEDYRDAVSYDDAITQRLAAAKRDFYSIHLPRLAAEQSDRWWDWYNKYLSCADWKALRQSVFARDNFKCQRCGDAAQQVHHLTYERVGYEDLDDLVSVCEDCHETVHQG